jgi:GntR family transcriptional regulator
VTLTRSLRHSLAQELRARIRSGEWRPGERMPSEPELARLSTVSRSSMRAAIAMLEEEGYVQRRRGSGTYVTHRPALPNDLGRNFGVSSLIASSGARPGTVGQRSGVVGAPPAVAVAAAPVVVGVERVVAPRPMAPSYRSATNRAPPSFVLVHST